MTAYVVNRLLLSAVSLFGVLVVIFLLIRVSGDPAVLLAGPDARPEDVERTRESLGLDDPLPVQFGRFMMDAIRLDFGTSFHWREPALPLVIDRVWPTLQVALGAIIVSLILGIPIGVFAALRRGTVWDSGSRLFALAGQAMPTYWLGLMLILLFSVRWQIFPTSGTGSWKHIVLPAVTLGWFSTAATVRMLRSSMIEVLGQDYVRTARAKGLKGSVVVWTHAFRNAAIPVVTLLGLQISTLISGSAIVETIFAIPGIGLMAVQAVYARDYPVVQSVVFLSSVILIVSNLLVDLLYGIIDPRIRVGGSQ
jgi:peptide/nickel transport system permease protein